MRYDNIDVKHIPDKIREVLRENTETITYDEVNGVDINIRTMSKGLLITGITGSGKTHCLYTIRGVVSKYEEKPSVSHVTNWVEFLFELKEQMGKINRGLRDVINDLTFPKYIFIDDLGAEKDTEWGQEMLYLVINKIYLKEGVLFLTTNLSLEELSAKYGDRIVDRLSELCIPVEMPQKNYRD